jgi:hypothetical protein
MRPTFKVTGQRQNAAAFGELKKATARSAMYRVLYRMAAPLDRAWRARAPRLSGKLAASGGIEKTSIGTGNQAFARAKRAGFDDAAAVGFKRDALRATAGERGLAQIKVGPGRLVQATQAEFGNEHQAADPYFRPALAETTPQAEKIRAEGVTAELDKARTRAAAKIARRA